MPKKIFWEIVNFFPKKVTTDIIVSARTADISADTDTTTDISADILADMNIGRSLVGSKS